MTAPLQPRPPRRRAFAVAAAGAGALFGAAGCGIQPTSVQVVGAEPVVQANDLVSPGASGAVGGPDQVVVYFYRDGRLTPVYRPAPTGSEQSFIIQQLIDGPSKQEAGQGLVSAVPEGISFGINAQEQAWAYKFSDDLGRLAKAQVVCSIQANTNAPSVGTVYGDAKITWNICSQDYPDLGAPAFLNSAAEGDSASASAEASPGTPGQ